MISPQGTRQKSSRKLAIRLAFTTLYWNIKCDNLENYYETSLCIMSYNHRHKKQTENKQHNLLTNKLSIIFLYDYNTKYLFEYKVVEAAAKVSLPTVYQRHSSMRTRKRMYMGWHLTNAGRSNIGGHTLYWYKVWLLCFGFLFREYLFKRSKYNSYII